MLINTLNNSKTTSGEARSGYHDLLVEGGRGPSPWPPFDRGDDERTIATAPSSSCLLLPPPLALTPSPLVLLPVVVAPPGSHPVPPVLSSCAATIQARVQEAEETERQIHAAREVYRPVPIRASLLYFVVADLVGHGAEPSFSPSSPLSPLPPLSPSPPLPPCDREGGSTSLHHLSSSSPLPGRLPHDLMRRSDRVQP